MLLRHDGNKDGWLSAVVIKRKNGYREQYKTELKLETNHELVEFSYSTFLSRRVEIKGAMCPRYCKPQWKNYFSEINRKIPCRVNLLSWLDFSFVLELEQKQKFVSCFFPWIFYHSFISPQVFLQQRRLPICLGQFLYQVRKGWYVLS